MYQINPYWFSGACDPFFNYTVLLLHCNGADGSTTITDSSTSAKNVLVSGTTQIDTAQSKFGGASLQFSGNSAYTANSADFNFGSSDLTVEVWIRPSSVASAQKILGNRTATPVGWDIFISTDGSAFVQGSPGASFITSATGKVTAGAWNHIAWVRSAGTSTLYINGVAEATGTLTISDSPDILQLGYANHGLPYTFIGHMDEVRITKGVARYTANFTPQTQQFSDAACATDPYWNSVSLLTHMDSSFTDSSANAFSITASGNAVISSAQVKFGAGSGLFDGNGDYISVPNNAAFELRSALRYTVEFWVYPLEAFRPVVWTGGAANQCILSSNTRNRVMTGTRTFETAGDAEKASSTITLTVNQWSHIALVAESDTLTKLYINGQLSSTVTTAVNMDLINFGGAANVPGSMFWGYMDDIRVTKGVARYVSDFTPPTAPFPNS